VQEQAKFFDRGKKVQRSSAQHKATWESRGVPPAAGGGGVAAVGGHHIL